MVKIHADDYALTVNTSKEMLDLIKEGVLDDISLIVNTSCREECVDLLLDAIPSLPFLPPISIHLNLVEGLRLSASDGSYNTTGWGTLFIASFIPGYRRRVKCRLKAEIAAQIDAGTVCINRCIDRAHSCGIECKQKLLRIDSHQHTHMIPVVWSALTEVIKEKGYETEYIRNPSEPLSPFFARIELIGSYRFANLIKNILLNILSLPAAGYMKKSGLTPMYMWGLMMSGRMDRERISKLYDGMCKKAQNNGRDLEILFHPGRMTVSEICPEIPQKSADSFYLSPDRDTEKDGAKYCSSVGKML